MTEHNGLPVAGYKPQSDDKVAIVNHNKELEERVMRLLDTMKESPTVDQRWLAIGRTDIEKGFMAVNRAVFMPGRDVAGRHSFLTNAKGLHLVRMEALDGAGKPAILD